MRVRILLVFAVIYLIGGIGTASADTICVPDKHVKVQWAIDNATGGDTIILGDGTYYENVNITKQLIIKSENGPANCIVDAGGLGSAITLSADRITLEGLTATNSSSWPDSGIEVVSNGNIITNNTLLENDYGIYLDGSSNNTITNNNISSNNDEGIYGWHLSNSTINNNNICDGIYLRYSSDNIISHNNVSSNKYDGVYLRYSSDNIISHNNVSSNKYDGIDLGGSSDNIVSHNTVSSNGDDGIDLEDSSDNIIINNNVSLNNYGGIELGDSGNSTIIDNNVSLNGDDGIDLRDSSNSTITNNTVLNNRFGIYLSYSGNSTVANNMISSNDKDGIELGDSSNSTITNNTVSSNSDDGISLWQSSDSTITNNNVLSNGFGIYLWSSYDNIISDNCFSSNNYDGMYVENSHNNDIFRNHINDNKDDGITIGRSSNNLFSNQIYNNLGDGILLGESIPENPLIRNTRTVGYYQYEGAVLTGIKYNLYFDNLGDAGTVEFEAIADGNYDSENFYIEECRMYKLVIDVGLSYGSGTLNVSSINATSSYQTSLPGYPTSVAIVDLVPLKAHMCGNNITSNQIYNNQGGIYLNSSNNNMIYYNDFTENSNNMESYDSNNRWNSTKQKTYTYKDEQHTSYLGNHWSDYTGTDSDNDGIGDTTYSKYSENDYYPLVEKSEYYSIHEMKCGDVNCDDTIDISDVIKLLYYVGYPGQYDLCNEWAGDVNGDGTIDISDVIRLLYYVGYPGQYTLECTSP